MFKIDPLNKFSGVSESQILAICGEVPGWLTELEEFRDSGEYAPIPILHFLQLKHPFAITYIEGSVDADGVFRSIGSSEPRFPYYSAQMDEGKVYQYENCVVCIPLLKGGSILVSME